MIGKATKIYSIFSLTCPRCHEGNFYKGHPYKYAAMGRVKDKCSKCGLKYNIEPSFFQGSYYVVYALGVALLITISVLIFVFYPKAEPLDYLLSLLISLLILSPWLYALSKIIWINFFIHYDKNILNENIK